MSGRQYPIWNNVEACIYKSSKDWGARERSEVTVNVGSSASNSHEFVTHKVTHKLLDGGNREFRFYVDGVCLKRAVVTAAKEFKLYGYDTDPDEIVSTWEEEDNETQY